MNDSLGRDNLPNKSFACVLALVGALPAEFPIELLLQSTTISSLIPPVCVQLRLNASAGGLMVVRAS